MSRQTTENKNIDESRQGEAFSNSIEKPSPDSRLFYIESYGCAMNFSDSEIVASILAKEGFYSTTDHDQAELILLNTCSIREKAEDRIRKRLRQFNALKKKDPGLIIGVLGCMAERLKEKLLEEEKLVDIVVGPDAYRDLPSLISKVEGGQKSVNVLLSREETYADITPVRLNSNGISAFISIMRGCDNMCSFCVVPFTRGRERSRDPYSIEAEARDLFERGYKEVTLLGQNVDSYNWSNPETDESLNFAQLLDKVASISPLLRVRFSTSHPRDMTDEVLQTMAKHHNICEYIHLPVQSGSTRLLELMKRTYSREWYLERISAINRILPDCAISSDVISGFCTETEEDHKETLSIMKSSRYSMSYMFFYSERPRTWAERHLEDDIPEKVKKRRLAEVIELQARLSLEYNNAEIGKEREVLIEGNSKRSDQHFKGRTSQNLMTIFPKEDGYKPGDYAMVRIEEASSATLKGVIVPKK